LSSSSGRPWRAGARAGCSSNSGPDYDCTLDTTHSKRDAEAELQAREEGRQQLEIRPLSQAARDRYLQSWPSAQAQFVDDPATLGQARSLDRPWCA